MPSEPRPLPRQIEKLAARRGLALANRPLDLEKIRAFDDERRRVIPSLDTFPD